VNLEKLVNDAVRFEYATVNDWALGRIADDDVVVRLISSYLSFLVGATRGAARKEIEDLLRRIDADGIAALPMPGRAPTVRVAGQIG
jgi:hypothetical protein